MSRQAFVKKRLPDTPGVYFFLGKKKKVLYIGRATMLRSRVRSYFATNLAEKRSPWIEKMLTEARGITVTKTGSVLEAILLEADLIKQFKPPYNTELKDDKSFNCIAITDEAFPRVLLVREKNIMSSTSPPFPRGSTPSEARGVGVDSTANQSPPLKAVSLLIKGEIKKEKYLFFFGPFPNSAHLKTALKIIRKIFPFRDNCTPFTKTQLQHTDKLEFVGVSHPCFNRQIGLCPGVCTGEITAKEYRQHIARLALFLSGKRVRIQKELARAMRASARAQEFEKAGELKRQLFALKHIQDVALITSPPQLRRGAESARRGGGVRIESYDLSHFGGKNIVGAMAVVEGDIARPSEYRLFKLRSIASPNETAGLQEIIRRRLHHPEWPFPDLIVVDGNEVQKKAAKQALAEAGYHIPVVAVVKDERHRPREKLSPTILLANAEAHRFALSFQKKQRR